MNKKKYNWIPDLPDRRDFLFLEKVSAPEKRPLKIDLRKKCSPIFDQGDIGSCTGNALAGALEFLEKSENERVLTPELEQILIQIAKTGYSR